MRELQSEIFRIPGTNRYVWRVWGDGWVKSGDARTYGRAQKAIELERDNRKVMETRT